MLSAAVGAAALIAARTSLSLSRTSFGAADMYASTLCGSSFTQAHGVGVLLALVAAEVFPGQGLGPVLDMREGWASNLTAPVRFPWCDQWSRASSHRTGSLSGNTSRYKVGQGYVGSATRLPSLTGMPQSSERTSCLRGGCSSSRAGSSPTGRGCLLSSSSAGSLRPEEAPSKILWRGARRF